ncbi:hypothetical protein AYO21_04096 [Fonsecaea monophora]|uniref:Chromosome segregation in meiosis protein n=1 Tax=Fonsecaea monophora TaxID=254056 RepID=A0A177FDW3_9EURO|nr:hypothetical protein AYO21_04096 [Fonsecaea monophora]OAG41632.1 hypothetical protein AYO21_04096 [Fonsecaea monophora]
MAADPLTAATVDSLLNLDNSDYEDGFNDRPPRRGRDDEPMSSPNSKRKAIDPLDATLGLDEEVKITKKRKPISKLDEARLLSAPGIPKLRTDARSGKFSKKLRLKGKGHEFSDVARLLNYYQLWLDNLYPRAKFADGLQLIEKAGHSRRMQVMRKEWIDEGKPGYIRERESKKAAEKEMEADKETDNLFAADQLSAGQEASNAGIGTEDDSLFVPDVRNKDNDGDDDGALPDDDELDALLAEQETRGTARPLSVSKPIDDNDSEGDDDLDALLAEQEMRRAPPPQPISQSAPTFAPKLNPSPFGGNDDDDDDDMDDLDALLAEQEARIQPSIQASTTQHKDPATSRAHEGNVDQDDDLDALLAEQEARQHTTNREPAGSLRTVRAATPPRSEAAVGDDGPDESYGADMFSSSPLQGTAPIGLGLSQGLADLDSAPPRSSLTSATARMPETGESASGDVPVPIEADTSRTAGTSIEAVDEEKEESQGVDAGDMFSSSPVQNE